MNVLVTGGAGYIGSALIKRLIDKGDSIVSIDNLYRGDYRYLTKLKRPKRLIMLVGDIRKPEDLEAAIRRADNVDAIVHAAAIPGLERCRREPEKAISTNVYGTYNILELARRHDVERVILTSSAAVYGIPIKTPIPEDHPLKPINLYGVTKLAAEKLMGVYHENHGLSTVILRFGNVYGVGLYTYWETVIPRFVKQALDGKPLTIYGDGEQSRDFIHIQDVTKAIELTLKAEKKLIEGETFNVGTEKPTKIKTVADIVSRVIQEETKKDVGVMRLPPRPGEPYILNFCLSTKKIRERLLFQPSFEIDDGVRQLIRYEKTLRGI